MAIDVGAQIRYWRDSSADDLDAARALLAAAKLRQAGFFVHLAVEKAIKACVVAAIRDVPPRSHDLLFLADKSAIAISQAQRDFLARMQIYCLEGRYPAELPPPPSPAALGDDLNQASELIQWLTARLNKP